MDDIEGLAPIAAKPEYTLRPGVSFCRVDGRTMFLDIVSDRYFCLSPAGERVFKRLATGAALEGEDELVIANLEKAGALDRDASGPPVKACPDIDIPRRSRLDDPVRLGWIDLPRAAAALISAPLFVRAFGLQGALNRFARRKRHATGITDSHRQARLAAAFAKLRLVATERDNCLTRSLAVAGCLAARGARPDLVIAVKLRPFYAHAWVQCDGWLINDRHEFVRNYTPILVL